MPLSLSHAPEVPDALVSGLENWGVPFTPNPDAANLRLELTSAGDASTIVSTTTWIYALVAPFPTVTDGVTLDELQAAWNGTASGLPKCAQCEPLTSLPLWMEAFTLEMFTALWGEPSPWAVRTVFADELVDALWEDSPAWGIVPFEELVPRLKVLSVDGQSPIHKEFDADSYALKAEFALRVMDRDPATLPDRCDRAGARNGLYHGDKRRDLSRARHPRIHARCRHHPHQQ